MHFKRMSILPRFPKSVVFKWAMEEEMCIHKLHHQAMCNTYKTKLCVIRYKTSVLAKQMCSFWHWLTGMDASTYLNQSSPRLRLKKVFTALHQFNRCCSITEITSELFSKWWNKTIWPLLKTLNLCSINMFTVIDRLSQNLWLQGFIIWWRKGLKLYPVT